MLDMLHEIISQLKRKGVDYADVRHVSEISESLVVKQGRLESAVRSRESGLGIRVLLNGAWGFASTGIVSSDGYKRAVERAIEVARASAMVMNERVSLGEPLGPAKGIFQTPIEKDPFEVPLADKVLLLQEAYDVMKSVPRIRTASACMSFEREVKTFLSTEGVQREQVLYRAFCSVSATAFAAGEVQRRTDGMAESRGYELITGYDWRGKAREVADEAAALLDAPECPSGQMTVIIGREQLALQIHESCGHPIELDRVLGYEESYMGTSFLTTEKLGTFRYGSDIVNIVADATRKNALGGFGFDDEGIPAQRYDIVRNGIFVGYLMSRETATRLGLRSNGAMRADGWANIPLIRMTSIDLMPGDVSIQDLIADTKSGVYLDFNKSWSIDQKRLHFQFGVERAQRIENGKLTTLLKNAVYSGMTPHFWRSCDAICGPEDWRVEGIPGCGKGQPSQTIRVSHGCAPARFRNVSVGVKR